MIVVGAGMAGLLAAAMLRNECEGIIEAQRELPNNHSAVLRFRTSAVGDVLNIPFQKVQVLKAVVSSLGNPVADALAYSRKTNGRYSIRSLIGARGELEERYIAPPDLIEQMAKRVMGKIEFSTEFLHKWQNLARPLISTMPMPVLMKILQWPDPPFFPYVSGFNVSFEAQSTNAFVSLYVPDPLIPFSRVSITGNLVQIEVSDPFDRYNQYADQASLVRQACEMLGGIPVPVFWNVRPQRYTKIVPIDENVRKRFILWASEEHGIYSLGRYATWRPGLLLDDLVKDVRVIAEIVKHGSYEHRK